MGKLSHVVKAIDAAKKAKLEMQLKEYATKANLDPNQIKVSPEGQILYPESYINPLSDVGAGGVRREVGIHNDAVIGADTKGDFPNKGFHSTKANDDFASFDSKKHSEIGATFIAPIKEFSNPFLKLNKKEGGRVIPLQYSAEKTFDYENPSHVDEIMKHIRESSRESVKQDIEHGYWQTIEGTLVQKAIKKSGFDSFAVKEFGVKNIGLFDDTKIRSTNAAFDPQFKDSSNLLGRATPQGMAVAGTAAAGAALMGSQESEAGVPKMVKVIARTKEDMPTGAAYQTGHTAPTNIDEDAPLTNLDKLFPEDIYSRNQFQYYGTGQDKADRESFAVINKVRNNPDADVFIYRAVPSDVEDAINPNDWVTLSPTYAKEHAEHLGWEDAKILKSKVKASKLMTDANSINEFGYTGSATLPAMGTSATVGAAGLGLQAFINKRKQRPNSLINRIGYVAEPLATVATGYASDVASGLVGAASLPFVGSEQAAKNIEAVQNTFGAWKPRTQGGNQAFEDLGGLIDQGAHMYNFTANKTGFDPMANFNESAEGLHKAGLDAPAAILTGLPGIL